MTAIDFTAASNARAKVAFTKSGSITADMTPDDQRAKDRDALLCEMAVARLWRAEVTISRKQPQDATMMTHLDRVRFQQSSDREAVLQMIRDGITKRTDMLEHTGWAEDTLKRRVNDLIELGLVVRTFERIGKRSCANYTLVSE